MLQMGQFPFARYPMVPGHEIAGVIEEVGEMSANCDRATALGCRHFSHPAAAANNALIGTSFFVRKCNLPASHKRGYQQFMLAPAAYVAPLPDRIDFVEAAPLMCAGLTVFSGLRHAGFEPGDKVAVIGLGGLGHMGVLFVRALGGRVAVLSTSAEKEAEARGLGAERFINLKTESASEALRTWEDGADIILATPPAAEPMIAAFPEFALNGTMVVLGAPLMISQSARWISLWEDGVSWVHLLDRAKTSVTLYTLPPLTACTPE